MSRSRLLASRRSLLAALARLCLVAVAVGLAALVLRQTPSASAGSCAEDPANLIRNGTMGGAPVATYWNGFINSGTGVTFENAPNEGWDPNGSQYIYADNSTFNAGVYQRVTGLTAGRVYHYWMVWGQTLHDVYGNNQRTDKIDRHIGIDLSGGTNPNSSGVQWSVPYFGTSGFNRPEWNLTFTATGSAATFFLRVINTDSTYRNKVFFDTVCLFPSDGAPTSTPWAPGGPTSTRTATPGGPTPTRTPTRTATPPICAVQPLSTISVGAHPKGLAVDATGRRVFVGLYDSSSVAVIDANTNSVVSTWPSGSGGHTNGVGFAQGKLFLSNHDTGNVSVLDGASGASLGTITVGRSPYSVGAAGDRAWVANFDDYTVSTLNATSNTLLKTVDAGQNPSLIAPLGSRAYISSWGSGLVEVDSTGSVQNVISLDPDGGTYGVSANPVNNRLYVSNRRTFMLYEIDANTDTVLQSVPEGAPPYALVINPRTNRLFILLAETNRLHVYDVPSKSLVADLATGAQGVNGGDSMAVLDSLVYVANNAAGTVSVYADCIGSGTPTVTRTATQTRTRTATPTWTPTGGFPTPTSTSTRTPTPPPTPWTATDWIYLPFLLK